MKPVVLVKLGGSLITNKSKPLTLKAEVLSDLITQVKKAWEEDGRWVILAHGSGSFGHVPAEKYRTIEGLVDGQSIYGAAVVEDAACQLNRIVIAECLKQGLPAITLRPFDFLQIEGDKPVRVFLDPLKETLRLGFLPVVYGDVVLEKNKGFTIWSTEKILNMLAERFVEEKIVVSKVIHCGETDGFLVDGKVIPEINLANLADMKNNIHETAGFDVTGGMLHKVDEAMLSAQKGIDSYIIGGNHGGNLYRAISGQEFVGTRIRT